MHKTRWARLPFGVRMTIGSLALLLPCVGGVFAVGAYLGDSGAETVDRYASLMTSDSNATTTPADATTPAPASRNGISAGIGVAPGAGGAVAAGTLPGLAPGVTGAVPGAVAPVGLPGVGVPTSDAEMPMGGTPVDPTTDYETGEPPPPSPPPAYPVVETSTVTETEAVPFDTEFVRDPSMPRRTHEERVAGEPGVKTFTYEVTTTDGQQTGKRLVSEEITRSPVTRVIAIGTGRRECDSDDDAPGGDGGDGGNRRTEQRRCDDSPGS